MQIKIEIDVKPEELRRFLGLPDVAGLQEDVITFLRDKVSDANENFDPSSFVRSNFDLIRKNKAWQRILYGVDEDGEVDPDEKPESSRRSRRSKSTTSKSGSKSARSKSQGKKPSE